ncbi:hypothetical protein ACSBR2_022471 [Camellia fascicularis]
MELMHALDLSFDSDSDDENIQFMTISKYFNRVLKAVCRLGKQVIRPPDFDEDCVGAIDDIHISVRVPASEKIPYRDRIVEDTGPSGSGSNNLTHTGSSSQQPIDVDINQPQLHHMIRGILLFIWKLKEVIEIMENMKDKVDEWEDKVDEWKDTWQDKNEDGRNG